MRPADRVGLVGAVDVQYDDGGGATVALVVCLDRSFATVASEHVVDVVRTAPYEPGALFRRELPCITEVLSVAPPLELLVVDGYATLDPQGRPGLGARAAAAFGIPVIGVAKTPFRAATHAAQVVSAMAGAHRIPTALARVDRLACRREQPVE